MKISSVFLDLAIIVVSLEAQCTTPRVRKEIRELTDDEYNRYIRAVIAVHKKKSSTGISVHETFTKRHYDGAQEDKRIHGTPAFLPWHRKFIRAYELELQKVDPSVNLPYWDWSQEWEEPHLSPVLTPLYLGGNGNRNKNWILDNGPFNNTQLNYPDEHMLRRGYDAQDGEALGSFSSTTTIKTIINNSKFSDMCQQLEVAHGNPHANIGNEGDFGQYTSPNDPIFYLHHAFIDLIWAKWQDKYPRSNQYEGDLYSQRVRSTDKMYGYSDTVASTFKYKTGNFCYTYPAFPKKITPKRTKKFVARASKKKGLMDDERLNSLIENMNMDQAVASLKVLETVNAPLLASLPPTFELFSEPNYRPLPDRFIQANNLDMQKTRQFEAQQLKLFNLFKNLHPIKDKLKKKPKH